MPQSKCGLTGGQLGKMPDRHVLYGRLICQFGSRQQKRPPKESLCMNKAELSSLGYKIQIWVARTQAVSAYAAQGFSIIRTRERETGRVLNQF